MSVKGKKRKGERIFKTEASSAPIQYFVLRIAANSCRKEGFVGSPGAVVKAMCLRAHLMLQDQSGPKCLA